MTIQRQLRGAVDGDQSRGPVMRPTKGALGFTSGVVNFGCVGGGGGSAATTGPLKFGSGNDSITAGEAQPAAVIAAAHARIATRENRKAIRGPLLFSARCGEHPGAYDKMRIEPDCPVPPEELAPQDGSLRPGRSNDWRPCMPLYRTYAALSSKIGPIRRRRDLFVLLNAFTPFRRPTPGPAGAWAHPRAGNTTKNRSQTGPKPVPFRPFLVPKPTLNRP